MKVFLLYNESSEAAVSAVLELKPQLAARGIESCSKSGGEVKKDIDESRYLILLAEKIDDLTAFEPEWRYFLNEIRWKRKAEGEIIILAGTDVDPRRVPFAIKGSETHGLNDTAFVKGLKITTVQSMPAAAPEVKPPLSAHAHEEIKPRVESGCKDEHIFESKTAKSSSYMDRLNAEIEKNRKAQGTPAPKIDPSDRKFDGISRPQPKPGYEEPEKKSTYIEMPRGLADYEAKKGDPFPDYKSNPQKKPGSYKGCLALLGVLAFFGVLIAAMLSAFN